MTKPDLGQKRACSHCGARFYDLAKNPAKCPKCGTMNDATVPVKAKRARKSPIADDSDDPLVKVKAARQQSMAKKPVKEIEDVDLEEFDDIETLDAEEDIEEIEEVEDIDSLEELEDADQDEPMDGDIAIEDGSVGDAALIDGVEEAEEGEAEEEEKKPRKAGAAKAKKKNKK